MLYQLPLELSLFLIFLDLGLLLWIVRSSKWKKWRTHSRIIAFVIFSIFSFLKWIGTSPTFIASSPNEVIFKSNERIGKLYLARNGDEGLFIFWVEKISGNEGALTLEMEGIYPNGLHIFKEIDQKLLEFRPDLGLDSDTWESILVEVNDSQFQPISQEGELALKNHKKVALANYVSQVVSLAFLTVFLFILLKSPMKFS